ncbi:MAG: hypothetical protein JXQ83_01595 [Candidatus Glassbacteria bacterium]|nr:hypothetical protein [Candidatus Glassbacteria bacterium]
MTGKTMIKFISGLAAVLAVVWFAACDNEHNVNAGNLVTVDGYVFQSRTQRVGVPDVTVVLEKSPDSGSPNIIPDLFIRTDENGHWRARFSLSYPDGGGVFDITSQYYEESMRIIMFSSESRIFDLGDGFTFQAGKTYQIWDVFLEDFAAADTTG